MTPTTYQTPEIRDANDNIIKQGSFGKNTALANSTNDGWIDYVANDLEFLYGLAKDEVVPVSELPSTGDANKTYLLTTTGVCYRWSGTEWVAVSSSEAVGRAETAASLAEQWATKTSGTVDGTEYSAKYYAEQAQDTADDLSESLEQIATNTANIEENAENIATNTGNIAQNTTDIDIAEKRISNIEKLLQGNLYDYQTDTDSAYTKTVLNGAMPYASLDSIGGKTLVWNQLMPTISAYSVISGSTDGLTITITDNTVNVVGTTTSAGMIQIQQGAGTIPANHKLFLRKSGSGSGSYSWGRAGFALQSNDAYIQSHTVDFGCFIRIAFSSDTTYNFTAQFNVTDLTLCYGSGNEPTTVSEFEAMFPASYYQYTQGELISAGVTEVVSKGKNLLPTEFPSNKINATVSGGVITSATNARTFAIPCELYTNYCFSHSTHAGWSAGFVNKLPAVGDKVYLSANMINRDVYSANSGNNKYILITVPTEAGLPYLHTDTIKAMINVGTSRGTYAPYKSPISTPIPAEIRNLEGYGWSAGTAYNYIDYERKVFVKNVGAVDLGTLAWAYSGSWFYSNSLASVIKPCAGTNVVGNLLTAPYPTVSYSTLTSEADKTISYGRSTQPMTYVMIRDSAYTTDVAFTTAMSGVTLYYELATPVEVDISAYLTDDNLIEVESGGTLTFPNSSGDDYRIDVPSSETYMVDLQSALGE